MKKSSQCKIMWRLVSGKRTWECKKKFNTIKKISNIHIVLYRYRLPHNYAYVCSHSDKIYLYQMTCPVCVIDICHLWLKTLWMWVCISVQFVILSRKLYPWTIVLVLCPYYSHTFLFIVVHCSYCYLVGLYIPFQIGAHNSRLHQL